MQVLRRMEARQRHMVDVVEDLHEKSIEISDDTKRIKARVDNLRSIVERMRMEESWHGHSNDHHTAR